MACSPDLTLPGSRLSWCCSLTGNARLSGMRACDGLPSSSTQPPPFQPSSPSSHTRPHAERRTSGCVPFGSWEQAQHSAWTEYSHPLPLTRSPPRCKFSLAKRKQRPAPMCDHSFESRSRPSSKSSKKLPPPRKGPQSTVLLAQRRSCKDALTAGSLVPERKNTSIVCQSLSQRLRSRRESVPCFSCWNNARLPVWKNWPPG
jgi:hypothetical protein